jgi:hypothetical protein
MISLEKAQQLKEAGLEWNLERGDLYYQHGKIVHHFYDFTCPEDDITGKIPDFIVFAPSLTQLIKEIDKHVVNWQLSKLSEPRESYSFTTSNRKNKWFWNNPLEDAVADSLLEILKGQ